MLYTDTRRSKPESRIMLAVAASIQLKKLVKDSVFSRLECDDNIEDIRWYFFLSLRSLVTDCQAVLPIAAYKADSIHTDSAAM